MRILILEGPNLNLVGRREPEIYGSTAAAEVHRELMERFAGRCDLEFAQSNHEGELIDRLHAVLDDAPVDAMVLNPGGLTHTSVALRDAVAATERPFVEVHLSNIYRREPFRATSYFSDLALGVISGLGPAGYAYAVEALLDPNRA